MAALYRPTMGGRRNLIPRPGQLPTVRCPATAEGNLPHEWASRPDGGFYCTGCLSRLDPTEVERWQIAVELAAADDRPALNGDAYGALLQMLTDTLSLTPGERALLTRLASEPGYVVTHSGLAEALWGQGVCDQSDRAALRQHVAALRRKLATLRLRIEVVSGVGYRVRPEGAQRD